MSDRSQHTKALAALVLANLFWGLSFPLIKAILFAHQRLQPDASHWFYTAMTIAPRFLIGTAVLAALTWRELRSLTAGELRQGLLLAVSAALGMLLQNDALQLTSASTSAFLTQFYAIMIPAWLALRSRRWPSPVIAACSLLVLAGVAILGHFDFRALHLGWGEIETLLCSVFFMVQILVLADRRWAGNRALPVTVVMFATEAVLFTGLLLATAPHPAAFLLPWTSGPWLGFSLVLTVFCTIGSFTLMNRWQPLISATEAGLVYCLEPVFTAAMALFLPGWLSWWAGCDYANETLTWTLLVGGGLITLANILLQLKPPAPAAASPA